jgi:hypothetical protein
MRWNKGRADGLATSARVDARSNRSTYGNGRKTSVNHEVIP